MTKPKSRVSTQQYAAAEALRRLAERGVTETDLANFAASDDIQLGRGGSKWRHGWVPLNAVAAAIKAKTFKPGAGGGGHSASGVVTKGRARPKFATPDGKIAESAPRSKSRPPMKRAASHGLGKTERDRDSSLPGKDAPLPADKAVDAYELDRDGSGELRTRDGKIVASGFKNKRAAAIAANWHNAKVKATRLASGEKPKDGMPPTMREVMDAERVKRGERLTNTINEREARDLFKPKKAANPNPLKEMSINVGDVVVRRHKGKNTAHYVGHEVKFPPGEGMKRTGGVSLKDHNGVTVLDGVRGSDVSSIRKATDEERREFMEKRARAAARGVAPTKIGQPAPKASKTRKDTPAMQAARAELERRTNGEVKPFDFDGDHKVGQAVKIKVDGKEITGHISYVGTDGVHVSTPTRTYRSHSSGNFHEVAPHPTSPRGIREAAAREQLKRADVTGDRDVATAKMSTEDLERLARNQSVSSSMRASAMRELARRVK